MRALRQIEDMLERLRMLAGLGKPRWTHPKELEEMTEEKEVWMSLL